MNRFSFWLRVAAVRIAAVLYALVLPAFTLGVPVAQAAIIPLIMTPYWGINGPWVYTNPKNWGSGQEACTGYNNATTGLWYGWGPSIYVDNGSGQHGLCHLYNRPGGTQQYAFASEVVGTTGICPPHSSPTPNQSSCTCDWTYTGNPARNACVPVVLQIPSGEGACFGNPIYPLTGAKKDFVATGLTLGGLALSLVYDTTTTLPGNDAVADIVFAEPTSLGTLWRTSYHHILQVMSARGALLSRGDGKLLNFIGDGFTAFTAAPGNPHKLVSITGGYRFTDVITGTIETFDATGKLLTLSTGAGSVLTFSYAPDNSLIKVQSNDGRSVAFNYGVNGLIAQIIGPDSRAIGANYDSSKRLQSLSWPDGKALSFLYENASLPWVMTGKVDENGSRFATFAYDAAGRAISTEHAGGADAFSVGYATPPARKVVDQFDSAANVVYRTIGWTAPAGTSVTTPNGQTIAIGAQMVAGAPEVATQSQPAGSGCAASVSAMTYDSNRNVLSKDDFQGARICYAYDASNRETVRIEGLANTVACDSVIGGGALPTGARKIATSWHPDWRMATEVVQPLRRTTTVYHGQPDPFNNGAIASCTSAGVRADGKPLPLVCKQVDQALLASGAVDTAVAASVTRSSYDASGRVLSSTDTNGRTSVYAYYADTAFANASPPSAATGHNVGDLQSVTDAAGRVTQYGVYDLAGQIRQMTDSKGTVTDITYTPRGWVSTVTVTPLGLSARTTSYSYDGVGQTIGAALPDGTSLGYTYDAAHRLVGITDTLGNAVIYTLDTSGNRIGEQMSDPTGALQRAIGRAFDALNRLQQVTGAGW